MVFLMAQMSYTTRSRIGLSSVLRPRQHCIGYTGDGFYESKLKRPNQQYQSTEGTYSTQTNQVVRNEPRSLKNSPHSCKIEQLMPTFIVNL